MRTLSRVAAGLAAAVGAVGAAGLAGLAVQPDPFPDFPQPSQPSLSTVPLPGTLPAPVHRWLRAVYGEELPVIESVVVTGHARVNPFGVWLPARFRFTHDAGRGYRHYIEACLYGRPVMRVNESYVDGRSLIDVPFVGRDSGPKIEQAANLGMWAELAAAAPAVLVTDERVHWRPIDATRATLVVPLGPAGRDELAATFDPGSGLLHSLQGWRYRSSKDDARLLWTAENSPGPTIPGTVLPAVGSATWADQGKPWAVFTTDDVRLNVDVSQYLRQQGI